MCVEFCRAIARVCTIAHSNGNWRRVMSDVGKCFVKFATKSLEGQNDMVGIWMLGNEVVRGEVIVNAGLSNTRSTIEERVSAELGSGTADDDCLDESAEERMCCDVDKGVHAVCRLNVPTF
jgi:hypothetical protein